MDPCAIKEIVQEHNGQTYTFPLGVLARNVEGDEEHRFLSEKEWNDLKEKLEEITRILGNKADILKVNMTVWVAQNGNDETGDGTQGNPWRTIQKALDDVPVINGNYVYNINLQAGTYPGFIASNVSASLTLLGDVEIRSEGMDYPVDVNNSTVTVYGEGHALRMSGTGFKTYFYIHNSGMFNTYRTNMEVTGYGTERGVGINVVSNGGFSNPDARVLFRTLETAIKVETNSAFHANQISGSVKNGINVDKGGVVTYESSDLVAAEVPIYTKSGGRVYSGSQE